MWFWRLTLRRGSHGPAVAEVKRRLFKRGYLGADGGAAFDELCRAAVAAFQHDHNLKPDGIVGPDTWRQLYDTSSREPTARSMPPWAPRAPQPDPNESRSVWASPALAVAPTSVPTAPIAPCIDICLSRRTLTLQEGDGRIRSFSVAVGRDVSPTPAGRFTVAELVSNPGAPFGTRWLRLHPGTRAIHDATVRGTDIHGTDEPWTIGADVTPGCVRMHNKDAEIVFHRVHPGVIVLIEP